MNPLTIRGWLPLGVAFCDEGIPDGGLLKKGDASSKICSSTSDWRDTSTWVTEASITEGRESMNQLSNRTARTDSIRSETHLGMTWVVMAGMVALLTLIGPPAVSAEQTATESVKSTVDEVIHILSSEELKQPGRSVERRQKIEHVIRQRVSYEDMAKRALGWPWIELTDTERQEFVVLFVELLRDTFAGRIDNYTDEQVLYLSEQHEENCAEVKTKLSGPKVDTLLDFRLADKVGHWYVYDVIIDGAGIVSNYHAQFVSIIRDHSYRGLVHKMKEKTLVVKAFETTTAP